MPVIARTAPRHKSKKVTKVVEVVHRKAVELNSNVLLLTDEQCAVLCGMNTGAAWRWQVKEDTRMPQPVNFPHPESRGKRWKREDVEAWINTLVSDVRQKAQRN